MHLFINLVRFMWLISNPNSADLVNNAFHSLFHYSMWCCSSVGFKYIIKFHVRCCVYVLLYGLKIMSYWTKSLKRLTIKTDGVCCDTIYLSYFKGIDDIGRLRIILNIWKTYSRFMFYVFTVLFNPGSPYNVVR